MHKLRFVLSAFLLLALGAARPAEAKLNVVTSIETFADLARQVGGDRVEVKSLQPRLHGSPFRRAEAEPDDHPQSGRPSVACRTRTRNRMATPAGGGIAQRKNSARQRGKSRSLDGNSSPRRAGCQSRSIDGGISSTGKSALLDSAGRARKRSRARLQLELKELDPAGAATYDKNLNTFLAELQRRRIGWEKGAAAPLRGLKVVTYHKSWSYVSAWLGLQ